jgi:hypothetical protein
VDMLPSDEGAAVLIIGPKTGELLPLPRNWTRPVPLVLMT